MRATFAVLVLAAIAIVARYGIHNDFTPQGDTGIGSTTLHMTTSTLSISSTAFEANAPIPSRFTCDGQGVNPELTISGVPREAKSLALIMEDPDVPKVLRPDGVYVHWVLFNIPPSTTGIPEGGAVGTAGANSSGKNAYVAPCPPPQYEPSEHRYVFTLYALDAELPLAAGVSKVTVESAMKGHIIAETQLIGRFKRQ
jgi:Raf kinase inhibitor-like YbhB/YbcL family protein